MWPARLVLIFILQTDIFTISIHLVDNPVSKQECYAHLFSKGSKEACIKDRPFDIQFF